MARRSDVPPPQAGRNTWADSIGYFAMLVFATVVFERASTAPPVSDNEMAPAAQEMSFAGSGHAPPEVAGPSPPDWLMMA